MSYRLIPAEKTEAANSEPASSYRLLPGKEESAGEEALRHTARSASRAAEAVAGNPGDVANAIPNALKYAAESLTGKKTPEPIEKALGVVKSLTPLGNLPTSGELKKKTENLSQGYLQAKGKGEELSDAIISDTASLFTPLPGKLPFLKSLGVAVGSNVAEKGVELLGGGENAQRFTKILSTIVLSAINPKGAEKYASNLYKEAETVLPPQATVSSHNLLGKLDNLAQDLHKGGTAPYKAPVLKKIEEIVDKVQGNKIPVEELVEFKRDLNQARGALYLEQNLDKGGRRLAKRNFDKASNIVNETLEEYGKTNEPWLTKFRAADEAYGAIAQSKKVSNAIANYAKKHPTQTAGALAAELFLAPKSIPLAATGYLGLKTGELMVRIKKSPVLREYYQGVLEGALKDDTAAIAKNLNKLDAALKKDIEKGEKTNP